MAEKKIQVDKKYIQNISGRDFIKWEGLLSLAHDLEIKSLTVELLQAPSKENGGVAICLAKATNKDGNVFSDIGDADDKNCKSMVAQHKIRMAATRAKSRALRDMTNTGMCSVDELGDEKPDKEEQKKTAAEKKANTEDNKMKAEKEADKQRQIAELGKSIQQRQKVLKWDNELLKSFKEHFKYEKTPDGLATMFNHMNKVLTLKKAKDFRIECDNSQLDRARVTAKIKELTGQESAKFITVEQKDKILKDMNAVPF